MQNELVTRITTTGTHTTTVIAGSVYVNQIFVSVESAGTTWTMKIQDKRGTPFNLVPIFTLTAPTDGKVLSCLPADCQPVYMQGGIDILTTGTSGIVVVRFGIIEGNQ